MEQPSKHCNRCDMTKPLAEFNRKGSGRQASCRTCQKAQYRTYYLTSNEKERLLANNVLRRAKLQDMVREAKDKPCEDCNVHYPYYVMDFDHVRGEKLFDIGTALAQTMSESKIREEIEKCDVVCANCHRIRTHARRVAGIPL